MIGRDLGTRIKAMLCRPGKQLGQAARFLRTQIELWQFCAKRLHEHNVAAMSAALSFRTIFALIPTLVLAFLVLRTIGVVEDGKEALRSFLDTSAFSQIVALKEEKQQPKNPTAFAQAPDESNAQVATSLRRNDSLEVNLPAEVYTPEMEPPPAVQTAKNAPLDSEVINVADEITRLVEEVEGKLTFERIGPVGAVVFIWTALTLLTTLESSLNRVFEAPRSRAMARRIVLFWSTITLGPILIVFAMYVGRQAMVEGEHLPVLSWLVNVVGWLAPVLAGILMVAAVYRLVPNTRVKVSSALGGALVSVPAWMIARWAFAKYVEHFVLEGNLYGVLGVLPLFLLWLNVSWAIFLFGAELAHTAANLSQLRLAEAGDQLVVGPSDWLAVVIAVARSFARGQGAPTVDQVSREAALTDGVVDRLLARLTEQGLLLRSDDEEPRYALARPESAISVEMVYGLADPRGLRRSESEVNDAVVTARMAIEEALRGKSVADLVVKS